MTETPVWLEVTEAPGCFSSERLVEFVNSDGSAASVLVDRAQIVHTSRSHASFVRAYVIDCDDSSALIGLNANTGRECHTVSRSLLYHDDMIAARKALTSDVPRPTSPEAVASAMADRDRSGDPLLVTAYSVGRPDTQGSDLARAIEQAHCGNTVSRSDFLSLRREALAYAAAELTATGEHGTREAALLLQQISDGLK